MNDLLADIERVAAMHLEPIEQRGLERLRVWFIGD